MDSSALEQRSVTLRHELKLWENQFALQHDGRKAGRDDIKADSAISQKYKEYNKIRDILSGRPVPQTPSRRAAGWKASQGVGRNPRARPSQPTSTPLKRKREGGNDSTDAATVFLSPQGPTMIGPTPQRDGIVLGLFDLLPAETPSKRRAVLADVAPNVVQTPVKNPGRVESEGFYEAVARSEKTPLSSGKRFLLDRFVTPKKRKTDEQNTPTSSLKGFSTPAFLRRNNVPDVIDEDDEATPRPAPFKRRSFGRSLSSMIQSMKKEQEERWDEEAEILRELEMEAEGIAPHRKAKMPDVLVEDSQFAMPLGPDGAVELEDEQDKDTEGVQNDENKGTILKKRQPKRQTRRVILRPSFIKPKPLPATRISDDSEQDDVITETQQMPDGSDDELSRDDDASEYASDGSHTPKKRKIRPKKTESKLNSQPEDKVHKDELVKTAARKIKATAHANYRKLKIKSKGSGGKGRFGRRR